VGGVARRDFVDDLGDRVVDLRRQQPQPLLVKAVPCAESLAQANRPQREDAGLHRLP
jgi:hypothetical protein